MNSMLYGAGYNEGGAQTVTLGAMDGHFKNHSVSGVSKVVTFDKSTLGTLVQIPCSDVKRCMAEIDKLRIDIKPFAQSSKDFADSIIAHLPPSMVLLKPQLNWKLTDILKAAPAVCQVGTNPTPQPKRSMTTTTAKPAATVSVTVTAKPAATPVVKINGALQMTVPDVAKFLSDKALQAPVKEGIAAAH